MKVIPWLIIWWCAVFLFGGVLVKCDGEQFAKIEGGGEDAQKDMVEKQDRLWWHLFVCLFFVALFVCLFSVCLEVGAAEAQER